MPHLRHWNLERVTIEATTNDPSGRKEKLVLEGDALARYSGIFWSTAAEREKKQPPELLIRLYNALIADAQTRADGSDSRLLGIKSRIQQDWSNTPAVELKSPNCDSEPWPPPYLLQ